MSKLDNDEDNGPSAFFRRLKKGVTDTVVSASRPVPGLIKLSKASNAPSDQNISFVLHKKGDSDSKTSSYKLSQFQQLLNQENVNLKALRKLSWNGIPTQFRTEVWQMMLGYMPINKERRENTIARKRNEYLESVPMYFKKSDADRTTQEGEVLRQIVVDLPRTCPNTPFFHQAPIQQAMERILYIWAIRHPASGYVQGMNDLLTPLILASIHPFSSDPLRCDVAALDPAALVISWFHFSNELLTTYGQASMEADAYWSLSKLLDNIQDHYTFSQPGLQRMILRLEDLVHRLDKELHDHFAAEGIQYMQFSFRWMNCALMRELPLKAIMRLWDTYFAEEVGGFENFHVYVCAVFLKTYRDQLLTMQFQEILMFLQDLPTSDWGESEVEPILSQAYILSTLFDDSPSHLVG